MHALLHATRHLCMSMWHLHLQPLELLAHAIVERGV